MMPENTMLKISTNKIHNFYIIESSTHRYKPSAYSEKGNSTGGSIHNKNTGTKRTILIGKLEINSQCHKYLVQMKMRGCSIEHLIHIPL